MNKKPYIFVLLLSSALLIGGLISAFSPTGAPAGYTGSPGDGQNCTSCHGGTATAVSNWITSNIPAGGYVPGQTYQVTASNNHAGSGKYGFQVSPQSVGGNLMGTLTAGADNKLVGNDKYVTHMLASTALNTWSFSWTAPPSGSGPVTFYGAFARGNPGPVALSTLTVTENATGISNLPEESRQMHVFPNPAGEQVSITLPLTQAGIITLSVTDLQGKLWLQDSRESKDGAARFNLSALPGGLYFFRAEAAGMQFTRKVVKLSAI